MIELGISDFLIMWFLYAILSAVGHSAKSISEKVLVGKMNSDILSFGIRATALILFLIPVLITNTLPSALPNYPVDFWISTIWVTIFSTPMEMMLLYKALKIADVSYIMPFISLAPILTTFWNYIFFHETIGWLEFLGITILVIGIYILNTEKNGKGILDPFKKIIKTKAVKYTLAMVVLYSLGYVADKNSLKYSTAIDYSFINYFLLTSSLFVIGMVKARKDFVQLKYQIKGLWVTGFFIFLYTILRFLALKEYNPGIVSAVTSVSVVFTVMWGYLFLKESDFKRKFIASVIVFIGLVLIKIQ